MKRGQVGDNTFNNDNIQYRFFIFDTLRTELGHLFLGSTTWGTICAYRWLLPTDEWLGVLTLVLTKVMLDCHFHSLEVHLKLCQF